MFEKDEQLSFFCNIQKYAYFNQMSNNQNETDNRSSLLYEDRSKSLISKILTYHRAYHMGDGQFCSLKFRYNHATSRLAKYKFMNSNLEI